MHARHTVVAAGLALSLISGAAQASTVVDVSGDIQGHAFTSQLNLDVVGSQAVSGTGTFTGYGLTNADLVLITTSTPGNETSPGPVGFRGNDGTDFGGLDQAYPISTNGLLFDVGTTTASFGAFPLFTVYSNGDGTYGAGFTGKVEGNEYYAQFSTSAVSVSVGTVPLPASAPMFGAALIALGAVRYGMKRKAKAAA